MFAEAQSLDEVFSLSRDSLSFIEFNTYDLKASELADPAELINRSNLRASLVVTEACE